MAVKFKKLQKAREKLDEEEAELERLRLQISELSRKTQDIDINVYK